MMSRAVIGVALLGAFALSACSGDLSGPNSAATPANGLLVSIAVPGRCIFTCDPISADLNHLALVTLTNMGSTSVFFPLCGSAAAINEQQFVGGEWINVGPAYACANGPISAVIAAHDSSQFNMWFSAGTWRLNIGAARDTTLTTEALSTSAAIQLK